ncbi:RutC family protein HI_1627 [Pseudomonas sp. 8AS]|uniref:RidA family protein n=1 Tax=Pseudomonas sp. 8AS TaxID=2653163 RepID=UPI0012F16B6A|nr:RidA family protein [Pseudomonas sp. 8AS]VXB62131.1 RutC family protein HI_1627 [Pseudomonas sp. 8AS]
MSITRLRSNSRLSAVLVHNGLVYLSGQVPDQVDAGCEAQCLEVLGKIDALLAEAGTERAHLLCAQIWLTDINADFAVFNHVWETWLQGCPPPTRATVQSPLARAGAKVEVMVSAALPH